MKTIPNLHYCCMTPYDSSFQGLHVLFPKENVSNTLGEVVSKLGLKQLRITEKFAHVTFFFNGGREAEFENEDRILIPSPKVATYDLQPMMSAPEVTIALRDALNSQKYDCIILNYANGDMVGHTGVYNSIQQAITLYAMTTRSSLLRITVTATMPSMPTAHRTRHTASTPFRSYISVKIT